MHSITSSGSGHCLDVEVIEAKDLKATNFFSSTASDSFCELNLRYQDKIATDVQYSTTEPKWKQTIQFSLPQNPEEETLFVSVWGKHVISRNTFIGRVEIPITLVIERDGKKENSFIEKKRIERWFKLMPKYGNISYDQFPGWLKLAFTYKYVPFVASEPPVVANHPQQNIPGANGVVVYSCPKCKGFFSAGDISQHMNSCSGVPPVNSIPVGTANAPPPTAPPSQHTSVAPSSVHHSNPPSYPPTSSSSSHNVMYNTGGNNHSMPPSSSPPSNNIMRDPSLPGGYSADPSVPGFAPSNTSPHSSFGNTPSYPSPPAYSDASQPTSYSNSPYGSGGVSHPSNPPANTSSAHYSSDNSVPEETLYTAPSYNFSNPF